MQDLPVTEDLLDSTTQAPVIRMINALLLQALRERASDLHFEPYETRSVVRFRVDGVLRDVIEPPRALHAALVSRLKIMATSTSPRSGCRRTAAFRSSWATRRSTCGCRRCRPVPASASCCACSTRNPARLDLTALGMDERDRAMRSIG